VQLGHVVGKGISTVKHPSLVGWRLLLVQTFTPDGKEDGEPLLAIDHLGAALGDRVIVSNDGASARNMVKDTNSPARWLVIGILDR